MSDWERAKYCSVCGAKGDEWFGHMLFCPKCTSSRIGDTARRWVEAPGVVWWKPWTWKSGHWEYQHELREAAR